MAQPSNLLEILRPDEGFDLAPVPPMQTTPVSNFPTALDPSVPTTTPTTTGNLVDQIGPEMLAQAQAVEPPPMAPGPPKAVNPLNQSLMDQQEGLFRADATGTGEADFDSAHQRFLQTLGPDEPEDTPLSAGERAFLIVMAVKNPEAAARLFQDRKDRNQRAQARNARKRESAARLASNYVEHNMGQLERQRQFELEQIQEARLSRTAAARERLIEAQTQRALRDPASQESQLSPNVRLQTAARLVASGSAATFEDALAQIDAGTGAAPTQAPTQAPASLPEPAPAAPGAAAGSVLGQALGGQGPQTPSGRSFRFVE